MQQRQYVRAGEVFPRLSSSQKRANRAGYDPAGKLHAPALLRGGREHTDWGYVGTGLGTLVRVKVNQDHF
jgi:hypothetical protein